MNGISVVLEPSFLLSTQIWTRWLTMGRATFIGQFEHAIALIKLGRM